MDEKQSKPCKKFKSSKEIVFLNPVYEEEANKNILKERFLVEENEALVLDCGAEVIKNPFTCYVLPNFIRDSEYLDNLKGSLSCLDFKEKNNDLFKFHQSDDLKTSKDPHIVAIKELLYGKFLDWLRDVTGLDLDKTIDMSCAQYNSTDILLCHDDQLESRKIAYIYYLVPENWAKEDGGTLDLLTSENGQPMEVVRSLVPKWNNFVFFEVSSKSFHQVAEIITDEKCRLSISGWFHSSDKNHDVPKSVVNMPIKLHEPGFVEEELIYAWINPTYLKEEIQMEIQDKFEEDSEIQLVDFFMERKFLELTQCFKASNLSWASKGPVNQRKFSELDITDPDLPPILKECLELMKSEALFLILSNLTGLSLHQLMSAQKTQPDDEVVDDNCEAKCKIAVREWRHGCYTLLSDQENDQDQAAGLDTKIFLNADDWKMEYGGFTSYVAKDEGEELLTVYPANNTLALVYKDKDTMSFVKHINHLALERGTHPFHEINFIYFE